jgi:hypothetical protein
VRLAAKSGKMSFVKLAWLAGLVLQLVMVPAWGADDVTLSRVLTCQDSWLDWQKSDPARLQAFGRYLHSGFREHGNDAFVLPKSDTNVMGFRLTQLFPDSVGMGVGTSATVAAKFDEAKDRLEKTLSKKLAHCETSDGMRSCELQIADKRTVMLMAEDDPKSTATLIGCYYFYEK